MKPKNPREAIADRLTRCLDQIEQNWIGRTIGIGYDCDTETGRIKIVFEPNDAAEHTVTIVADITDVSVGTGDAN
jgi:hypothetical protein